MDEIWLKQELNMVDKVSKEIRSKTMRAIRSQDTKAEILLRKALWNKGYIYRKNVSKLYGKPDVVFRKNNLVVFVDSCFWHVCPYHFRKPKSNRKYWNKKIARNKKRDKDVNKYYRNTGWNIIRFWEHSINSNVDKCIDSIIKAIHTKK